MSSGRNCFCIFELNKVSGLEILIFWHFLLGMPQIKIVVFWIELWDYFGNDGNVDNADDEVPIKNNLVGIAFHNDLT